MAQESTLSYLEWIALSTLYKHRDKTSSPVRYIGLLATITHLMNHRPALAQWVGKPSDNQVHITPEGIALYEANTAG
jgi:hypothetical protein